MNNYTIYMHKNKINGKCYIGQTCQKVEYRWDNGKGYENCSIFYKAIQKYGWDNFEHIILKENLSLEEANYWEEYYIKYYHTWTEDPQCWGYNIQKGGDNHLVSDISKEKSRQNTLKLWQNNNFKEKMSLQMKEKWKNPEKRQQWLEAFEKARQKQLEETGSRNYISEEGKKRISEARKQYILEHGTPTQGKHRSEETKEKIRQTRKEKKLPPPQHTENWFKAMEKQCIPVQCIETGEIFPSRKAAANWAGLKNSGSISAYITGAKKSAGKHPETNKPLHWKNIE